eukprot:TRINITY_DN13252_c0_g1_i1.p1 TRINITY_DN13252_c0_g1~~TRINITY_DN13252_c0_g1_i1.p1  ORF type:complete len:203 (+),score=21.76 TRINITY_DN13252_c0_g1_i1:137-745(+)
MSATLSVFVSNDDLMGSAFESTPYTLMDVLPTIFGFCDILELSRVTAASMTFCGLAEPAWRDVFGGRWSGLFSLKINMSGSWRRFCNIRALARRTDLKVNDGQWRICGICEDRNGRVMSQGKCDFASTSYTMRGRALHFREGTAVPMKGKWCGQLSGNVGSKGTDKAWTLGWKEKLEGQPVCIYSADLHEDGGVVILRGALM